MTDRLFPPLPSGETSPDGNWGDGEIVVHAFDAFIVKTYTLQRLFLTSSYQGLPNVELYRLPPTCTVSLGTVSLDASKALIHLD